MHDIGSSRPTGWGPGYNEFEQELSAEAAGETAQEFEGEGEFETEFEVGESEFENEFEGEVSGEMQEMELAAELLAVSNEQEMEQFLGGLIKSVGRAATNFAKSSAGKALGGILRSAAKCALPIVGSALGTDDLILMHTTSTYPSAIDELNLRTISMLEDRYGIPVGYSGHEVGLAPSVAAVALGACVVERHITLDRAMWGSDQAASVEPQGFERLVRDIRVVERALGDGVKRVYESELEVREKLRRVP